MQRLTKHSFRPFFHITVLFLCLLPLLAGSCTYSSSSSSSAGTSTDTTEDPAEDPTGEASPKSKWTYMVYIGGDNNLSSAAFTDINDMETVGSTDDVNIVVQTEFSRTYTPLLPRYTMRGRITRDNDTRKLGSTLTNIGNVNMASSAALTDFIDWATGSYPAENYALVLWDHGNGWRAKVRKSMVKGAIEDETAGTFMSLPEIASAISSASEKPQIINFDACLMAMYEVAYEFRGLADYMVFSEEVEPGSGDPYSTILNALTRNPDMDAKTLSKTICEKYKAFYTMDEYRSSVTKSAVDMTKIPDLHTAMEELADEMVAYMDTNRTYFQTARDASIFYYYRAYHDLGDYLEHLAAQPVASTIRPYITAADQALRECVISSQVVGMTGADQILDSTGLSVFLPRKNEVTQNDLADYGRLAINSGRGENVGWVRFVNTLVTGDTGSQMDTRTGNFAFWLTWDTDADLDLIIWEPDGSFAAPFIGATSDNGFLSQDSWLSGNSEEMYLAFEQVEAGEYDVLVNFYEYGASYVPTTATLHYLDPEGGYSSFTFVASRYMSLQDPAPYNWMDDMEEWGNVWYDVYSDWWYPFYLERADTIALKPVDDEMKFTRLRNFDISVRAFPKKSRTAKTLTPVEKEEIQNSLNAIRKQIP